jgi:hypothetical protein
VSEEEWHEPNRSGGRAEGENEVDDYQMYDYEVAENEGEVDYLDKVDLHSPDLGGRMDKGERFECREETHM